MTPRRPSASRPCVGPAQAELGLARPGRAGEDRQGAGSESASESVIERGDAKLKSSRRHRRGYPWTPRSLLHRTASWQRWRVACILGRIHAARKGEAGVGMTTVGVGPAIISGCRLDGHLAQEPGPCPLASPKSSGNPGNSIRLTLNLDGAGRGQDADRGSAFSITCSSVRQALAPDLDVHCEGDLHVDAHHSTEDVGICLGQAIDQALGTKAGSGDTGIHPADGRGAGHLRSRSRRPVVLGLERADARAEDRRFRHASWWPTSGTRFGARQDEPARQPALRAKCAPYQRGDLQGAGPGARAAWELDPRVDGIPSTKGALTE